MTDDRRPPAAGGHRRRPASLSAEDNRPFDLWLNRQLHALYDDIAREPLPADVIATIERHGREAARAEAPAEVAGQAPAPADPAQRDKA